MIPWLLFATIDLRMGGGVGETTAFGATAATGAGATTAIAGETIMMLMLLESEILTVASTSTEVIHSNGPVPTTEAISTLCCFASFTKQIDQLIIAERLQNLLNRLLLVITINDEHRSGFLLSILSRSRCLRNFQSQHTLGVRKKIHGPKASGIKKK